MDLLREEYGIVPAGMLGHSAGEIACGYADGALTREQTVRLKCPVLLPPNSMGRTGCCHGFAPAVSCLSRRIAPSCTTRYRMSCLC